MFLECVRDGLFSLPVDKYIPCNLSNMLIDIWFTIKYGAYLWNSPTVLVEGDLGDQRHAHGQINPSSGRTINWNIWLGQVLRLSCDAFANRLGNEGPASNWKPCYHCLKGLLKSLPQRRVTRAIPFRMLIIPKRCDLNKTYSFMIVEYVFKRVAFKTLVAYCSGFDMIFALHIMGIP